MEEFIYEIDNAERCVMTSVWAKDLRYKENLQKIPNDKPGWYRWWAPIKVLEKLRITPDYLEFLCKRKLKDEYFYCVYVGIAVKESIRARLNWHVNQRHRKSAVQSGTLSTFRQSISSLVAEDQFDEDAANQLIDMLIVEYCAMDYTIKSDEAKNEIECIEKEALSSKNSYVLPLNIQGNKNVVIKQYLTDLKKVRKISKIKNPNYQNICFSEKY